ncbi:complement resistance protein TraT [Desulfovibrio sp. ZJ200]|uniref:complement resistance protein TraT n=1 Tax=Desulfovibrio sp. ZJ200 TaxID=2709792 RepID=UPI0013ED29B5|nr:complement resistance protein TraT [Desulfovibrio sp. ZJ200]
MPKLRFFLFLLLSLCLLCACIRRGEGDASQVEVLRCGELSSAGGDEDIADVVYINVRDKSNRVPGLRSRVEACVSGKGFTVTGNPSQAGHIIQITVLDAGPVDPDSLRGVVDAGYDAPSRLSGTGGTALLTDVLLVRRRVPNARRAHKANLKNISRRNAVASSHMRLALLVRHEIKLNGELPEYFTEVLARELGAALKIAGRDAVPPPGPVPAR